MEAVCSVRTVEEGVTAKTTKPPSSVDITIRIITNTPAISRTVATTPSVVVTVSGCEGLTIVITERITCDRIAKMEDQLKT